MGALSTSLIYFEVSPLGSGATSHFEPRPITELSRYSEYGQTSIAEHLRLRIRILIKLLKRLKWVDDQIKEKRQP
jgi:hypothetical protein